MNARGTFEVKITPQPLSYDTGGEPLARMTMEKILRGDLDGTSRGEMLSSGNPASGFAGAVAIERVSGTLGGRDGTFVLQHSSTMNGGAISMNITVVPHSGTAELAGISGTFKILFEPGGGHAYDFEYNL